MMQLRSRTLGEICDEAEGIIRTGPFGSQLHASDYTDEGIPVVMPQDIVDGRISVEGIARIDETNVTRLAQYQLHKGDIVYGRRGDIGRRALITSKEYSGPKSQVQKGVFGKILFLHSNDFLGMGREA